MGYKGPHSVAYISGPEIQQMIAKMVTAHMCGNFAIIPDSEGRYTIQYASLAESGQTRQPVLEHTLLSELRDLKTALDGILREVDTAWERIKAGETA